MNDWTSYKLTFALLSLAVLTACTLSPDPSANKFTGNAASAGIGAAAGLTLGFLGAPKPVTLLAALTGAGIGYYMSTTRFDAGGVLHSGGAVYTVGDMVTIEIPSYQIFDPDTSTLLPQADRILTSAATVLQRYPDENILISANSSGYGGDKHELSITADQARQVAGFLWAHGINNFTDGTIRERKLTYVGYGARFPIANNLTAKGINDNNRIQITAYPSKLPFLNGQYRALGNIGALNDASVTEVEHKSLKAE